MRQAPVLTERDIKRVLQNHKLSSGLIYLHANELNVTNIYHRISKEAAYAKNFDNSKYLFFGYAHRGELGTSKRKSSSL